MISCLKAFLGLEIHYPQKCLSACNCVKAFFDGHDGIRGHVLRRAIEGHKSGDDAVPNILTVLLEPPNTRANSDPYQQWMAAVLLLHLLLDHPESKELALKVSEAETEAESEDGYEVVTFVQSITSNVVAGVQHPEDERALLGYLMLLSTWLFEEPKAVNDLLGEVLHELYGLGLGVWRERRNGPEDFRERPVRRALVRRTQVKHGMRGNEY